MSEKEKEVYKQCTHSELEEVRRLRLEFPSLTNVDEMEENIRKRKELLGLI